MQKKHTLHSFDHAGREIFFFYKKEKRDTNGNARFRVYITDPNAQTVYEVIFKTYEADIYNNVKRFLNEAQKQK